MARNVRNRGDAGGGNRSAQLGGLFPEAARGLPWALRFTHELLDRTTLDPPGQSPVVSGHRLLFVAQRLESNAGLTASQP